MEAATAARKKLGETQPRQAAAEKHGPPPRFFVASRAPRRAILGARSKLPPGATRLDPTAPKPSWRLRHPAVSRFLRDKLAVFSLGVIVLIVGTALLGPLFWPHDPAGIDLLKIGQPEPPTWQHPAGIDESGRDMVARLMVGAQISLAVGVVSMVINLVIGVGLGAAAAWFGGWVDTALMRLVDALYGVPLLLIVILIQLFVQPLTDGWADAISDTMRARHGNDWNIPLLLQPDLLSIYLALGLANWLTMARLARAEVMNQAARDYVAAARSLGASSHRLVFRHVLPNSMAPLLVAATLAIPEAIFIEAFLAFIGLGVSAPFASWGTLASDGARQIAAAPHLLLLPAAAISVTMLAFNLFGDGLRDALDPGMKDT